MRTVARFPGATPIGVTVSRAGCVFMSFPCAFDVGPYDVAEIKNGRPVPYPNAAVNRLWLLDLGIIKTAPTVAGRAQVGKQEEDEQERVIEITR